MQRHRKFAFTLTLLSGKSEMADRHSTPSFRACAPPQGRSAGPFRRLAARGGRAWQL